MVVRSKKKPLFFTCEGTIIFYFSLVKDTTAEIIGRQCFSLSPSLSKSMFSIVLFYESE